jgi:hypothetical protein
MLRRWRRISPDLRHNLWWLYGHFVSLMMLGSVAGVVAWAANLQYITLSSAALEEERQDGRTNAQIIDTIDDVVQVCVRV